MVGKKIVTCAKCGITSNEDTSLNFHRFPLPSSAHGCLKAKVWAKFCFPSADWNDQSLLKLFTQHKMLCTRHFDKTCYISSDSKKLNKFAIPIDAKSILAELQDELRNPEKNGQGSWDGVSSELSKDVDIKEKPLFTNYNENNFLEPSNDIDIKEEPLRLYQHHNEDNLLVLPIDIAIKEEPRTLSTSRIEDDLLKLPIDVKIKEEPQTISTHHNEDDALKPPIDVQIKEEPQNISNHHNQDDLLELPIAVAIKEEPLALSTHQ